MNTEKSVATTARAMSPPGIGSLLLLLALELLGYPTLAQQPLALVRTIEMPEVPTGPYADHMALDSDGRRLFTTPQANRAIDVLNLDTGAVHTVRGFGNPHAILYRADRNLLFVTDGKGVVKVLDGTSYRTIRSIQLEPNADSTAYDARSGYLYVGNGGAEAGRDYSLVSIIDTARETKIGDIRVDAGSLESMVVDAANDRLYVNLEAFALDADHHALFVGCNEGDVRGSIVIVDTTSGKELEKLPIGSWVDSMFYDARRQRIYASTGIGEVFTYERRSEGSYRALEPVDTAIMARTSLFSPELDRLFVMVPHLGWTPAKVLVFKPAD